DIMVIAHTDCGVQHLHEATIMKQMIKRGITPEAFKQASSQVNLSEWLSGFEDVFEAVSDSVQIIKHHPLFPSDVAVYGYVMDTQTGELHSAN
ncbi:MAG: carbonic anhydrase, partial [Niameybacter sp.]